MKKNEPKVAALLEELLNDTILTSGDGDAAVAKANHARIASETASMIVYGSLDDANEAAIALSHMVPAIVAPETVEKFSKSYMIVVDMRFPYTRPDAKPITKEQEEAIRTKFAGVIENWEKLRAEEGRM